MALSYAFDLFIKHHSKTSFKSVYKTHTYGKGNRAGQEPGEHEIAWNKGTDHLKGLSKLCMIEPFKMPSGFSRDAGLALAVDKAGYFTIYVHAVQYVLSLSAHSTAAYC